MKFAWGSAVRLAWILWVFARHGLAHLLGERAASWPILHRRLKVAGLPAPERLRILFEDMGGTFIKFGQMLALQPDILPVAYCDALFNLLDRIEPFAYSEVERIVVEELGRPPEEIFDSFDAEPLATASVGQVHVARLEGRKVAVKVQRPDAELEFWSDIRMMKVAMGLIRGLRLKPLYWMLEPMSEFVGWTQEELDYHHEASYSERLRGFAGEMPGQYVPKVYQEYTTRRTLVVEFLDGVTLLDYLRAREKGDEVLVRRLEQRGFDRRRFAANVIENFLGNAFRHGIYHADLHPANLMILEDSVVGYIDFGITGMMSTYSRQNLVVMTLALAQGDIPNLCGQFLKVSRIDDDSDVEGFRQGLEELTAEWYEQVGRGRRLRINFTRVMTEMLELSRQTGVMPERDIIKYIRSAIAIDGLNSRFEPDFHVGQHLEKVCSRFLQWQGVQSLMTNESMASVSSSTARLVIGGPARTGQLFDRFLNGELPVTLRLEDEGEEGEEIRSRALHLGAFVFALAFLMSFTGEHVELGWNLFTAEAALISAGLVMLLMTLRRLA